MGDLLHTLPIAAEGGETSVSIWGLLLYVAAVFAVIYWFVVGARKGLSTRTFTTKRANWGRTALSLHREHVRECHRTARTEVHPDDHHLLDDHLRGERRLAVLPLRPYREPRLHLGMALVSIGYVQWEGIKANGLVGHLSHFAGPKLGLAFIPLSILLFCIELVSELMKNVSLSLRIFANIHGGHEAVTNMNKVGEHVFVPIGAFLLPLKILTCIIQAMIFCLLTCVYIGLVTSHHEDAEGDDTHGTLAHA